MPSPASAEVPSVTAQADPPRSRRGRGAPKGKSPAPVNKASHPGRSDRGVKKASPSGGRGQRRLRSQAAPARLRSQLSSFFPKYDKVMGNELAEPEYLPSDAELVVEDDEEPEAAGPPPTQAAVVSEELHNVQRLDFSAIAVGVRAQEDPLASSLYEEAHLRGEKREKRLQNVEKNRVEHEKGRLERLLEGLKGPDWPRVLGVGTLAESEKEDYEPQRGYFIREAEALLTKFREFKEEERRREAEKDQRPKPGPEAGTPATGRGGEARASAPPAPTNVDEDELAARQLQQEAILATGAARDEALPPKRRAAKAKPRKKVPAPEPEPREGSGSNPPPADLTGGGIADRIKRRRRG